MRRKLIRYAREVDIQDLTKVHLLRHTFISWLAMADAPKGSIKDIVGHVDDDTFERYRHTTDEHRAGLLKAVDIKL
ncbi:MAG: site-specific integrase [Planctomycetes bacterium]|nr:site-specific integrase [Planctomycetota bacterium]